MTGDETARKTACFADLGRELARLSGTTAVGGAEPMAFWVPGRIEVLGKHTDYGGGRSLLCAVERGLCVLVQARGDPSPAAPFGTRVRVRDAVSGETTAFELSPDVASVPGHWSNYAITVSRRIAMNFGGPLRGADIVFASDLPRAAGVSSSSALVVAVFLALSAANDLPARAEYRDNIHTLEDLGGYLGGVENGLAFKALAGHAGVGTFGGSEDQTAILCARPRSLVQYSFCPVTFERAIALPAGYSFVIAASGVMAEKTGAALADYNRVSRRLSVGLECWRRATGRDDVSMGAAIASSSQARDEIRNVLADATDVEYTSASLLARFDQFDAEANEIIPAAGDALARGDLEEFGTLVGRSQAGAERGLNNQTPETMTLVRHARALGAVAASAFGAGFGGSVWAMVELPRVEAFRQGWSDLYHAAHPEAARSAQFFASAAGPAATRV